MKSMAKKKIGGFMCHSPAATAVCMTPDSRSVIVPGRRSASERNIITQCSTFASGANDRNAASFNSVKYSKLVDYHNRRNPHHRRPQTKVITTNNAPDDNNSNNKQLILPPAIKKEQALTNISTDDQKPVDLQKSSSLLDSVHDNVFQVVVMRVSLHCQGCAGKLKKYLSKMEGVTSFSIELEHKRVTVMGHVSPVIVLENISKVRRAEFWPTSAPADHDRRQ